MEFAAPLTAWIAAYLGPFAPRMLAAIAIVAATAVAARLLRTAVLRAGTRSGLDQRVQNAGFTVLLADAAQWLLWLLALPALLGALELRGLLDPVNAMVSRLLAYLPQLLGAAVVAGVGLLLAGMARRITSGLLAAAGSERAAARMGLAAALGERRLSDIGGNAVFVLLLLPTVTAALQVLGLDAVTRPVAHIVESITALVPRLAVAALIVLVGAVVGRALASLVTALLAGMGIQRWLPHLGLPPDFRPGGRDAAELGGLAVMVAVLLLALAEASKALGLALLTDAVAQLGILLGRAAAAGLVLAAGAWLAGVAAQLVAASGGRHTAALARAARGAVLFFALALALRQAGLPGDIVTLGFGAVVCGLSFGAALAFGLGGRTVAERLLERLTRSWDSPPQEDRHGPPTA